MLPINEVRVKPVVKEKYILTLSSLEITYP